MIGYATLGTNDLERAKDFYDKVLEPLGGKRVMAVGDRMQLYGAGSGVLGVCRPHDGKSASAGNGSMFGVLAPTTEAVDAAHAAALANGGACAGPPGPRGEGFYAAYFHDLDGNKLCVFKRG